MKPRNRRTVGVIAALAAGGVCLASSLWGFVPNVRLELTNGHPFAICDVRSQVDLAPQSFPSIDRLEPGETSATYGSRMGDVGGFEVEYHQCGTDEGYVADVGIYLLYWETVPVTLGRDGDQDRGLATVRTTGPNTIEEPNE